MDPGPAGYLYQGLCPLTGARVSLPRNRHVESVALQLASQIDELRLQEGKMFGVLVGCHPQLGTGYLKAFSGQLHGQTERDGWAPPLHLATPTSSEAATVARLAEWKGELARLKQQCDAHPVHALKHLWHSRQDEMKQAHRAAKQARDNSRESCPPAELQKESRRHSMEWRDFRRAMVAELSPLEADHESLRRKLTSGKRERAALSRALQAEMHEQFSNSVASLLGCPLPTLFPQGIPTGTGDCCAPKLLAMAARHQIRPLALAELWWGPENAKGKASGHFYPACEERCQPLLGPLLAAALRPALRILHQDEHLIVVDKPTGLLSVPGRSAWAQDSALTRLQRQWPETLPVHRLDLETSGVLLFARDARSEAHLRQQFEQRRAHKTYLARLGRRPEPRQGRVEAPLGPDPDRPGCYRIDSTGKRAVTDYTMLDETLIELRPLTGRSHQLRVHLAQALGCPIKGDGLYGEGGERLHLHAARLEVAHPRTGILMLFESPASF